jgi:hypothetical protein
LVRLREVRLVVPVVAVAEPTAGDGEGSAMASVSIVGPRGERALLAFTGVPALVTWNAQARPVPASGRDVAMAALADGAALLVDPAGPVPFAVSGAELDLLAGRGPW